MLSIDFVKISNSIYRQVNISESGSISRFIDSAFLGMWPIALRLFIVHVIIIIKALLFNDESILFILLVHNYYWLIKYIINHWVSIIYFSFKHVKWRCQYRKKYNNLENIRRNRVSNPRCRGQNKITIFTQLSRL